jgi:hypothetical protein
MPVFSENNKEKVHWMLYDSNPGDPRNLDPTLDADGWFEQDGSLPQAMGSGNVLEFFTDISRKTKLETNMDTAGMLSRNSFEVRALRVVIAALPLEEEEVDPDDPGLSPRVIEEFIYNSITTLSVGEKKYLEVPTFMCPSGAGPHGGNGTSGVSHGEPNPMATFRFAEPIVIPPQQSFRVEITFPHGLDENELTNLYEEWVRVWVILDGYLIRDVQ